MAALGLLCHPHPICASSETNRSEVMELRVTSPDGKPVPSATVRLVTPPTEVEDEGTSAWQSVSTGVDGVAALSVSPDWSRGTAPVEVEILSPDTRRARYRVRDLMAKGDEGRGRVVTEQGITRRLTVVDGLSRKPLPNVVIGPVNPDDDAPPGVLERCYPFFARTDSQGQAEIFGLIPGVSYTANLRLSGYQRRRIRLAGQLDQSEALVPGGTTLTVQLQGHRTAKPYGRLVVQLLSPDGAHAFRRADERGLVEFAGLSGGDYRLQLEAPDLGETLPVMVTVQDAAKGEAAYASVPVPEGLHFSGYVTEAGTSVPLAGITLLLGANYRAVSGADGRFEFRGVLGPWPRRFFVVTPGYKLDFSKQPDSGEVAGFDLKDRDDLSVPLRPERFLEVRLTGSQVSRLSENSRVRLTLRKVSQDSNQIGDGDLVGGSAGIEQTYMTGTQSVLELDSADPVFVEANTDDREPRVSAAAIALPVPGQTTTALDLLLEPSAQIRVRAVVPEGRILPPGLKYILNRKFEGGGSAAASRAVDLRTSDPIVQSGLPPGSYELVVPRSSARQGSPWARVPVQLKSGVMADVEVPIDPGAPLAGKVVDPDGAPLPEIAVTVHGSTPSGDPIQQLVMTDRSGKFRTEGWGEPAVYSITTRHHLWRDGDLRGVPVPSLDTVVKLVPRASLGIQLQLPENQRLLATGHLLHESLQSNDLATNFPSYSSDKVQPFAGRESVTFLPQLTGTVRLGVAVDGRWLISGPIPWSDQSEPTTVTLQAQAPATLTVRAQGEESDLSQAVWTLTNQAIPDGLGTNSFEPVREGGLWKFFNLPSGPYMLLGSTPSGATAVIQDLEIKPGESVERTVDLTPSLKNVAGRLLDSTGGPRSGKVSIFRGDSGDSQPLTEAEAGADGGFILKAIPAGQRYLLVAESPDGARATTPLDLAANQDPPVVELKLRKLVLVTLTLTPELNQRIQAGVKFVLRDQQGEELPVASGEGGPPRLNLSPGNYSVLIDGVESGVVTVPESGGLVTVRPLTR